MTAVLPGAAQTVGFSGTWKLDRERSRVAEDSAFAALIAAGAPERLHITQPANGTLVIESEVNEGHARIYTPRTTSTTPVAFQGGTITISSRWAGRSMIGEGILQAQSGAAATEKHVKEVIALSDDARTLTIEITTSGPTAEPRTSTLTYSRTQDVGPCETWSTPCKRPK